MNKIVREHYPVDKLPADLRQGLPANGTVRVVIDEVEETVDPQAKAKLDTWANRYWLSRQEERPPSTPAEMLEMLELYRAANSERITMEEAVARIRELRDEWED